MDLLLKHGADVNADDFWGRSPLFTAVEFRNRDLRNRDLIAAPVDRAAFLEIIDAADRAWRERQRAHARMAA